MPPLISFPIDLARTGTALESIAVLLDRIAGALERLSPPPPPLSTAAPYKAGLGDLRYTDAKTVSNIREELAGYAQEHSLAMDSELFLNSIMQYERDIVTAYGPNAILELPWNKAAGGALFQTSEAAAAAEATRQQSGTRAAEAQARQGKTD